MNRVFKAAILSIAAIAAIGSTVEVASAGDRHWRRHHVAKPWKKRVMITGIAAGAMVVSRPRIIYRDHPVIADEAPVYDDEAIYGDDGTFADPDEDTVRRVYRDDAPEADDYATPSYDDDAEAFDDQSATEGVDDDFPDRPKTRVERQSDDGARKDATSKTAPRRKTISSSDASRKEANAVGLKPWSSEWKEWCAGRFPSFNPQNGTYLGYDRKRHFCKAG